jgi:hypothetical protein
LLLTRNVVLTNGVKSLPSLLLVACCLLLALSLSCGDADAPAQPTLSPPPIDPRLNALAQGFVTLDVAANSRQPIDPLDLAMASGAPPDCASFVFLFTWQTSASDRELSFVGNRQGGVFDIVRGSEGQASVSGCILLEAVNDGGSAVRGDLRYIIAEVRR